jgi:hypothetical protein
VIYNSLVACLIRNRENYVILGHTDLNDINKVLAQYANFSASRRKESESQTD